MAGGSQPFQNLRQLVSVQSSAQAEAQRKPVSVSPTKGKPVRNPIPKFVLTPGLPVTEHAEEIVEAIRKNRVLILCGETGSGKTTQLPKLCLMADRGTKGMIAHTQPRRIAASSVAKRIAEELKTPVGDVVGFKVRFTDATQPGATIKLMTDGILLAETQSDPLLRRYDTIIIDEAHERSINIDFLLGYLKTLLSKRPDLKVIVTSATIDAERFAKHFAQDDVPAPILTVQGRTYPVEVRYRPIEDVDDAEDATLMAAIVSAVDELEMEGSGDILVFLPGEREIHEAEDVLQKSHRAGTVQLLPLFARLPSEGQERIFKPCGVRRIILATNVAETSITVPGIRYVVDAGLARIKRYSYRNKVEQLLIEPVSQASAKQRSGRCGRLANGVCIRLYSEEDFNRRPAFTDPEIIRSNLAAVILRMKSLKLGDIRAFPFVQAPPPKAISDGLAILSELNAMDRSGELTEVGKSLSRLPIDPRLSRMLLAAHRYGALREALIIIAGLSIQDPRERPMEAQAAADTAQALFKDKKSDFLSFLKIWNWSIDCKDGKTNRQYAEELRSHFLSARRMREWKDVWHELGEITRELGWKSNAIDAPYDMLHRALLTGLLGNIGMRQVDADFRAPPFVGARGIHFWIWPGSSIAKKAGKWIMANEVVETSRLFARNAADIEPEWLEEIGAHLLKKSWTEPHWEKHRGEVVALEKATLYGLPVYAGRAVSFARHDPTLARELFIRSALVESDYDCHAPFFQHNRRLIREIEEIEHKTRRPDVLVDEETLFAFYDERIDKSVVDQASFEHWLKDASAKNSKCLFLEKKDLMRRDDVGEIIDFYPKTLTMAGLPMALNYHFEPGSVRDGVTLTVPLYALNQIDEVRCEWLVLGMLREKVQALAKGLPQRFRRHLVPLKDYAEAFFSRTKSFGKCPLMQAIAEDLRDSLSLTVATSDFKTEFMAPHLFMNFKIVDEHGRQLEMGRNLAELKAELGREAQAAFREVAEADAVFDEEQSEAIVSWSFGTLPELLEIKRKGETLFGHPALVDRGDHCTLEVFDEPVLAKRAHRGGLRRLMLLAMKQQVKFLEKNLLPLQRVQMQASVFAPVAMAFESFEGLRSDVVAATIDSVALAEPWPQDAQGFDARVRDAKGKLNLIGGEIARLLTSVAEELTGLARVMKSASGFPEAVDDVRGQMRELFPKGFLLSTPLSQLRHYERYVRAARIRLEKVRENPQRDAMNQREFIALKIPYVRALSERKGVFDERLDQFRWLLEELRVSLYAQELKTPMPVSVKRLTRLWASFGRL